MIICVCVCVCLALDVWRVHWLSNSTVTYSIQFHFAKKKPKLWVFREFPPNLLTSDIFLYLPSFSHIWILASGAACRTEQAWLWLSQLTDLWRRLRALCCVWDCVALHCPTKSAAFPRSSASPGFQSGLWLVGGKLSASFFLSLSAPVTATRQWSNLRVMRLLWLLQRLDWKVVKPNNNLVWNAATSLYFLSFHLHFMLVVVGFLSVHRGTWATPPAGWQYGCLKNADCVWYAQKKRQMLDWQE